MTFRVPTTHEARGLAIVAMTLAIGVVHAAAQSPSLADVAKKEAERRKAVGDAGKTYTDKDLKRVAPGTTSIPAQKASGAGTASTTTADGKAAAPADGKASGSVSDQTDDVKSYDDRGEAYWRERATAIRAALESARNDLQALNTRAEALQDARGGAEQRERDIVIAGQKRAKENVDALEGEWSRFEKRAQAANVPAAWIR